MANARFTDSQIKSLEPAEKRYILWEPGSTGMGLRVSTVGKKSWIFMCRVRGKSRMITLGNYPMMTLAEARQVAAKARAKVENGQDPASEHLEEKRIERLAESVGNLIELYIELWAKPRKKSWQEDERILNKEILPIWGDRKAKEISRKDIVLYLDSLIKRGMGSGANRILAIVRKMFNFALSRDMIEYTPCFMVKAPSPERTRDRVLSDEEITRFYRNLEKCRMSVEARIALKLMIVTAQRAGEVTSSEWSEIDFEKRVWNIPKEKSKNKKGNIVPLTSLAVSLFKQAKLINRGSKYVFPSPGNKDHHMRNSSIDHALRRNLQLLGVKDFVPHDLRRTAASKMAELGVNRLIISKILNHTDRTVTAVYDRHSYLKEKLEALTLWSEELVSMLNHQEEVETA